MTKIVIVGGVAGGASAAARARRLSEDAQIIMFERGPFVSLVNYMIDDIKNSLALLLI
ncbi:pyridine nucleotide-disulfide oxidoreductase [Vibrio vulnificus]|nr:pyridine nucleotide-disulfide oxidoreductase [Vibrio vulnificus]